MTPDASPFDPFPLGDFPLGRPVNRKPPSPAPTMQPIAGRPGWWLDVRNVEHYIDQPPAPAQR